MDEQNPGQPAPHDPQVPGQVPPPPQFAAPQQPQPPLFGASQPPPAPQYPIDPQYPADPQQAAAYPPPAGYPAPAADPYAPAADPYAPPAGAAYGAQPGQAPGYPPPPGGAPFPPAGPGGFDPYGQPVAPKRRNTARTVIAVIAGLLVVGGIARAATHNTSRPSVAPTKAKDIDARKMQVGDCIKTAAVSDNVTTVPFIACTEPHAAEVYYVLQMTDTSYPGTTAVEQQAEAACSGPQFTSYVGKSAADSSLDVFYLYPTSASFAQGDRAIDCLAGTSTADISGSVKGSNK